MILRPLIKLVHNIYIYKDAEERREEERKEKEGEEQETNQEDQEYNQEYYGDDRKEEDSRS